MTGRPRWAWEGAEWGHLALINSSCPGSLQPLRLPGAGVPSDPERPALRGHRPLWLPPFPLSHPSPEGAVRVLIPRAGVPWTETRWQHTWHSTLVPTPPVTPRARFIVRWLPAGRVGMQGEVLLPLGRGLSASVATRGPWLLPSVVQRWLQHRCSSNSQPWFTARAAEPLGKDTRESPLRGPPETQLLLWEYSQTGSAGAAPPLPQGCPHPPAPSAEIKDLWVLTLSLSCCGPNHGGCTCGGCACGGCACTCG